MKKAILTAAFAALALGAAQALTERWSIETGWTAYGAANTDVSMANGAHYDLSLSSIAYTGHGISDSNATAAKLILADNTITNLGFLIFSSGDWNSDAAKAIGLAIVKDSQVLAVSTGTHYEFNRGEGNKPFPGQNFKGFISFDFGDGFEMGTYDTFTVYFLNTTTPSADLTFDDLSGNYYTETGPTICADAQGNLTYRATGELIPEPTALALLALGVAGMALRRKVA